MDTLALLILLLNVLVISLINLAFLSILGSFDSYTVNGKTLTINNDKRTYDGHPDTGVVYVVNYNYHNDYEVYSSNVIHVKI